MKKHAVPLLLALALAVAAVAAAHQNTPKADVVVTDGTYDDPSATKVEILGACTISAENIDCWNFHGVADAPLSEQVRSSFESQNNQIWIRFHKKNRLIVYRVTSPNGTNAGVQFQDAAGQYLQGQTSYNNGVNTTSALWTGSKDDKTVDVMATLNNLPGDPPIVVPFSKGQKFSVEGLEYEIGDYRPGKLSPGRFAPWSGVSDLSAAPAPKIWDVLIGYSPYESQNRATFTALNAKDQPILYVDKTGKPITPLQAAEERKDPKGPVNPNYPVYPNFPAGNPTVYFNEGQQGNGVLTVESNINPAYISKLRITTTRSKVIEFKDVPLDPSQ